jgi:osmotically-inducible protein OsmY
MNIRRVSVAAIVASLAIGASSAFAYGSDHPIEDSVLTTKVKAKLVEDNTTKARHINVTTKNGVVTLSGTVDSTTEKDAAAQDAQKVEGVASVDNQLTVKE